MHFKLRRCALCAEFRVRDERGCELTCDRLGSNVRVRLTECSRLPSHVLCRQLHSEETVYG